MQISVRANGEGLYAIGTSSVGEYKSSDISHGIFHRRSIANNADIIAAPVSDSSVDAISAWHSPLVRPTAFRFALRRAWRIGTGGA